MANKENTRVEFTEEEKKEFLANNTKVNFWIDKTLIKEFDKIAKIKGASRKDGITNILKAFVKKNKHLLEDLEEAK